MRQFIFTLLLFVTSSAWSFQCPQDYSVEKAFNDAERGFLIYVTETKLEEVLLSEMIKKYEHMDASSEDIKLVSAGYRIVEEFKGTKSYQPRLIDMLGIGTGYVGLAPGQYYLILLPKRSTDDFKGMRRVDSCTAPLGHYRLDVQQFQDELNKIRTLRDTKK